MPSPGDAEIPLDLTRVPTVAAGLREAAAYDRSFSRLVKEALGPPGDGEKVLVTWHLPLIAFINRAVSLHRAIVSGIKQENPHAVFTLMRAYLELVVLVEYVVDHPDYIDVLQHSPEDLPPGKGRKSYESLVRASGRKKPGVRRVYRALSEMAHFGSTAMWHPFDIVDREEGRIRFGTPPHWQKPDDAMVAVTMLLENDEAMLSVLVRFTQAYIVPAVLAAISVSPSNDGHA
jgi:hypothetical protein